MFHASNSLDMGVSQRERASAQPSFTTGAGKGMVAFRDFTHTPKFPLLADAAAQLAALAADATASFSRSRKGGVAAGPTGASLHFGATSAHASMRSEDEPEQLELTPQPLVADSSYPSYSSVPANTIAAASATVTAIATASATTAGAAADEVSAPAEKCAAFEASATAMVSTAAQPIAVSDISAADALSLAAAEASGSAETRKARGPRKTEVAAAQQSRETPATAAEVDTELLTQLAQLQSWHAAQLVAEAARLAAVDWAAEGPPPLPQLGYVTLPQCNRAPRVLSREDKLQLARTLHTLQLKYQPLLAFLWQELAPRLVPYSASELCARARLASARRQLLREATRQRAAAEEMRRMKEEAKKACEKERLMAQLELLQMRRKQQQKHQESLPPRRSLRVQGKETEAAALAPTPAAEGKNQERQRCDFVCAFGSGRTAARIQEVEAKGELMSDRTLDAGASSGTVKSTSTSTSISAGVSASATSDVAAAAAVSAREERWHLIQRHIARRVTGFNGAFAAALCRRVDLLSVEPVAYIECDMGNAARIFWLEFEADVRLLAATPAPTGPVVLRPPGRLMRRDPEHAREEAAYEQWCVEQAEAKAETRRFEAELRKRRGVLRLSAHMLKRLVSRSSGSGRKSASGASNGSNSGAAAVATAAAAGTRAASTTSAREARAPARTAIARHQRVRAPALSDSDIDIDTDTDVNSYSDIDSDSGIASADDNDCSDESNGNDSGEEAGTGSIDDKSAVHDSPAPTRHSARTRVRSSSSSDGSSNGSAGRESTMHARRAQHPGAQ